MHRAPAIVVPRRFAGWRMVVIGCLAQNCAIGLNFGTYGPLVQSIQSELSTTRALAASGIGVMTVAMGVMSPVVGALMQRFSLRRLMIVGAVMCAIGYSLLALVHDIWLLIGIFALVVGPGVCLLGVIPSSALVANWFVEGRGRVLGIVNMQLFIGLLPPIAAALVQFGGLRGTYGVIAGIFLCLIPLLTFVITRPEEAGQRPRGSDQSSAVIPTMSSREILRSTRFIVLTLGIGFLTMAGVMMAVHVVPLAHDRGISLQRASTLLSAYGIANAIGAPIFGMIADRIGGRLTLAALAFGWMIPWSGLLIASSNVQWLLALVAVIGLFSGGINPLLTTVMSRWMGQENFGRAMGLCYFLKIPFLFSGAPLAGHLFDLSGSYRSALLFHIATFAVIGTMFVLYRPQGRR